VAPQGQHRGDALLRGRHAKLLQAGDLREKRGLLGQVVKGRGAPEREGVPVEAGGGGRIRDRELPCPLEERLEAEDIDLRRINVEDVPPGPALQPVRPQGLAEVGHVGLEDVPGRIGRLASPDLVDQAVGRHELLRTEQQVNEDRPLLRASQGDRASPVQGF
jgi:hypothetical protein